MTGKKKQPYKGLIVFYENPPESRPPLYDAKTFFGKTSRDSFLKDIKRKEKQCEKIEKSERIGVENIKKHHPYLTETLEGPGKIKFTINVPGNNRDYSGGVALDTVLKDIEKRKLPPESSAVIERMAELLSEELKIKIDKERM